MEQLQNLLIAFVDVFSSPETMFFTTVGIVTGVILGAIPGLSSTVGLALVIPFSYYLSPLSAIAMMYAMHKAGTYGGSIVAILINTPGTAAAACTQLDGYPLTLQGKSGKALRTAAISSAIGDFCSDMLLIFGSVYVAKLVWICGPVEIVGILFFALVLISGITGKSPLKGLFSACLGILLSLVGLDPANLASRFTFGYYKLDGGLGLIPVLTGLFILSEVFIQVESVVLNNGNIGRKVTARKSNNKDDNRLTLREFKSLIPTISLSTVIGSIIGILPGLGAAVAPFISYGQAKSISKHPERFGHGALEGVAAAESANNAVCGANLIPLFSFGIPGSTDAALMMSVFMINGIEFGPMIFQKHTDLVYGIYVTGLIAIAGYFLIGMTCARKIGEVISRISVKVLYPSVLIISFIGVFADKNSTFSLIIFVVFGIIGYFMKKYEFPIPPLIISFMLGLQFETNLRQALAISDSGFLIFLMRPISCILIMFSFMLLAWNIGRSIKGNKSEDVLYEE